ncbi:hypothetical protein SCUP234_01161 [Seiridium cupressi]
MALKKLPNELVLQAFQQIDTIETLQAVACTCRKFREIAEICIYSQALCTKRLTVDKVLALCRKEPTRASYLLDLQLLYSTRHYDFLDSQAVDLGYFPCLRSFVSESPFCNSHSRIGMKDESIWRADMQAYLHAFEQASLLSTIPSEDRPLSNLRSLTLHWTGSLNLRFWETTSACPIFLLPELRTLTVSCVKIKAAETEFDVTRLKGQTKLESLTFVESVVSPDALGHILSYPNALRSFSLQEINYHRTDTSAYKFFKDDNSASLRALAQQSASIRRLHFFGRHVHYGRRPGLDLSELRSLEHLQLSSSDYRIEVPPPFLETICLNDLDPRMLRSVWRGAMLKDIKFVECVENCAKRDSTLTLNLRLQRFHGYYISPFGTGPAQGDPHQMTVSEVLDALRDSLRDRSRYTLAEHPDEIASISSDHTETAFEDAPPPSTDTAPVRLRILTAKRVHFIPPFLHSEKQRRWVVRYDSRLLEDPYYEDSGILENEDSSNVDEHMRGAFQLG